MVDYSFQTNNKNSYTCVNKVPYQIVDFYYLNVNKCYYIWEQLLNARDFFNNPINSLELGIMMDDGLSDTTKTFDSDSIRFEICS